MALIETLKDRFDDNSLNGALWDTYTNAGGVIAETGEKITFTPQASTAGSAAEIASITTYDLTASSIYVNLYETAGPSVDNYLILGKDGSNRIAFFWASGDLLTYTQIAGVESYRSSTAITAGANLWLRIRESSGTVHWEYSINGQSSWVSFDSIAVASLFTIDLLTVFIGVYEYGTPATPGVSRWDSLNYFHLELSGEIDSVTISESVSISSTSLTYAIDVSDSVVIEDSVQVYITGEALLVDVYDAISVEEVLFVFVDINDVITIGENVNVDTTFTSSVSDSMALTESISSTGDIYLSVNDSVSVSEYTNFYFRLYGTVVQTKATNSGEPLSEVIFSMDNDFTAGNMLVIFVAGEYDETVTSITDDSGNTYTEIDYGATAGDYCSGSLWYAKNLVPNGGGPPEITATFSGDMDAAIIAREYLNLSPGDPLDVYLKAVEGASSNSHTVGATSTTTEQYDTVVAAYAGSSQSTYTAGTGYGNLSQVNGFDVFRSAALEDMNVYELGGQTATLTSATFSRGVFIIAAFRSASGNLVKDEEISITESVSLNVSGSTSFVSVHENISFTDSPTVFRVPIFLPIDVSDSIGIIDDLDVEPLDPRSSDTYFRATKYAGVISEVFDGSTYGGRNTGTVPMKTGGYL